jgi:hypothetical protein
LGVATMTTRSTAPMSIPSFETGQQTTRALSSLLEPVFDPIRTLRSSEA